MRVRVQDADALAQAVREEASATDGECLGGVPRRAEGRAFRVHELEGRHVVLLGVRRKKDRPGTVHAQPVPGEVLRVVVVEAEWARRAEGQSPVILGHEDERVLLQRDGQVQRSTR